tara:strand:- start:110 stop:685 length:576 start_codon:yes stop_codon:yes gene_type:complete
MAYVDNHPGEANYYSSIHSYKMANSANTKRKNWIATDDRAQEIIDFVQFEDSNGTGFLSAVKRGVDKFGKPTENMRNAMVKMIDKRAAQKAEWATRDGKCEFVGTVGDRQAFTLTVKHVVELDGGNWGTSYINICRDADDNVVIYKGSNCWEKGNAVECMAKVKDHGVREGVKQTIIQRPTKVKVNGKDWY